MRFIRPYSPFSFSFFRSNAQSKHLIFAEANEATYQTLKNTNTNIGNNKQKWKKNFYAPYFKRLGLANYVR